MLLDIREWICLSSGIDHDRDENASKNITAEGIRQLSVLGTRTAVEGWEFRLKGGRKSVLIHSPPSSQAPASVDQVEVVHVITSYQEKNLKYFLIIILFQVNWITKLLYND